MSETLTKKPEETAPAEGRKAEQQPSSAAAADASKAPATPQEKNQTIQSKEQKPGTATPSSAKPQLHHAKTGVQAGSNTQQRAKQLPQGAQRKPLAPQPQGIKPAAQAPGTQKPSTPAASTNKVTTQQSAQQQAAKKQQQQATNASTSPASATDAKTSSPETKAPIQAAKTTPTAEAGATKPAPAPSAAAEKKEEAPPAAPIPKDVPVPPLPNGEKYFQMEVSHDAMMGYIPKGTPVHPNAAKLDIHQLQSYIKSLGFTAIITEANYKMFVSSAKSAAKGFAKDFVLVVGTPPAPPKPGGFEWLNPPNIPRDQVNKGTVFMKAWDPEGGKPGVGVKGAAIGGSKDKVNPIFKKIAPQFKKNPDGTIEALEPGQAVVKGEELAFNPVYEIESPNAKEYQKAEFFSSVHVKADVPASVVWKIHGDLHVDGHWSSGNIEIDGNATAESGIQTNLQGTLKVGGVLKTSYLQRTKVEVGKDLIVESGILLCEVMVSGDIKCDGSPGAIMGSKIECHGTLKANKCGSDRGVVTEIKILRNKDGKKSTIDMLCQGTKMHVYETKFIQQIDGAYESPP